MSVQSALSSATEAVSSLIEKATVVAASAVTFLSGLAVAVTAFSDEVAAAAPAGWEDNVLAIGVTVAAWLAAAVAAIRRVTPVSPDERGVLPK